MNELIKNAYDLHVHSAPDVVKRKSDDLEIARDVVASGMKGYVIKSHYFNTAGRAALIKAMVPGCNAIGALVLNNSVGGLNPNAVEMAARAGTKIIWFPTMDAQNMWDFLSKSKAAVPFGSATSDPTKVKGISILKDGTLVPEVYEILDLIAKYDLILATGHISKQESLILLQEAKKRHINRIIVTHVDFPATFTTIEEQKEFIKYGAILEHTYVNIINKDFDMDSLKAHIRGVGAENIILSTDLGQYMNPSPVEGFGSYLESVLLTGISEKEIERMVVKNTSALVEQ